MPQKSSETAGRQSKEPDWCWDLFRPRGETMRLQTEIEMEFRSRQQLPLPKLFGSDFTEATGGMEGGTKVGLIQLHRSE